MKISKYTHLFSLDNRLFLAYNCLSGCIVKSPELMFKALVSLKENGYDNWDRGLLSTDEIDLLKESGIIVKSDLDEEFCILQAFNRKRENPSHLSLTIAPTMDCNFSCFYCYEQNTPGSMEFSVENQLEKFVKNRLYSVKSFSVSWLGGEPLLQKETVFRLTECFRHLCRKNDISSEFSMTTNGYLLDEQTADRMIELGIDRVQITLDGLKGTHDKRRYLKCTGKGSFNTIVENLKINGYKFRKLQIRMNVDRHNKDEWKELKGFLITEGILPHAAFYISGVDTPNEHNQPNLSHCLTGESFAEFYSLFLADLADYRPEMIKLPSMPVCGAIKENYLSVDPDGYLYKCWNDLGFREKSVGHISKPKLLNSHNSRWQSYNPLDHEICAECNILPICMGKCPDLHMKFGPGDQTCSMLKKNLREMVLLYYLNRKRNKTKAEMGTM